MVSSIFRLVETGLTDEGIFFLYFQARLHTAQAEPEEANGKWRRSSCEMQC